jgi:hypothetical protein
MAATKSRAGNKGATKRSSGGGGRGNASSGRGKGSSQVATDHDEIRRIVEEKDGRPACVRGTESDGSCLLRIDYPGGAGDDKLEPMDWEEFFQVFDENKLAMAYDTKRDVRFTKFVSRSGAQGTSGSSRAKSSRGGNKGGSSARGGARSKGSGARAARGQPGEKPRGRASGKAGSPARGGSSSRRAGGRR